MSIENYIHFIVQGPLPILFLFGVIFLEYIFYKIKGKKFSFVHMISNFAVLFIGITLFSFFNQYILSRDSVITFMTQYALFSTPLSWTWFIAWLVLFDCISYWTHILYHKSAFFWMFHSVHHTDNHLDASTTIRVPFIASFFTVTSYAFFCFLGVNPLLLPAIAQTMFLHQILTHSFLLRTCIPQSLLQGISYVFVTPPMHAMHHTRKHSNTNYGFLFSFWDRLFKTLFLKHYEDEAFGVDTLTTTHNPLRIHTEGVVQYYKKS